MSKTYPLTNPAALAARIAAAGGPVIDPSQPTGEIAAHGCKLGYAIANGSITVTLLHKPFGVPDGMVFGKLDQLFAGGA